MVVDEPELGIPVPPSTPRKVRNRDLLGVLGGSSAPDNGPIGSPRMPLTNIQIPMGRGRGHPVNPAIRLAYILAQSERIRATVVRHAATNIAT